MSIFFILEKKFITLTAIKRGLGAVFHKFALDLTHYFQFLKIHTGSPIYYLLQIQFTVIQDNIT